MSQQALNEISFHLDQVLALGIPEGFFSISVSFDPDKKPIRLVNALHHLDYMSTREKGIVIAYAADPRNLHDRAVFQLLVNNKVFEGFVQTSYGYEGGSFHRNFGSDKEKIMGFMQYLFAEVAEVTQPEKCLVRFSGLYGPAQKPFEIID